MSENLQSHALKLLDSLLKQEVGKRRVKNSTAFLTTLTGNPPWDKRPDIWAPDWCQGWSFAPEYAMADALGIELTPRTRLEKVLDSEGRPVPELDAMGKPKISKGKPVYQKVQHRIPSGPNPRPLIFGQATPSTPRPPNRDRAGRSSWPTAL